MEPFELLQLMTSEAEQVDSNFEFWLMGTFAVVVAVHAARASLTRVQRHMLASLYALFAVSMLLKFWADADSLAYYAAFLEGSGYTMNRPPNLIAGLSRLLLYVVGSIAAFGYVYTAKAEE